MSDVSLTAGRIVPGRIDAVRPAAAWLVDMARRLDVPAAGSSLFENAIVEALTNAVQHNPREGETPLRCELEVSGRRLTIRVLDEAAAAPVALALPAAVADTIGSWQDLPERGYGLRLIQAVFPEVRPVTREGCHGIEMALTF